MAQEKKNKAKKAVKKKSAAKAENKKVGRPAADWKTKETAEKIFNAIREGLSLREVCRIHGLPMTNVCQWLNEDEFREQYADACEARADKMFDEIITIADTADVDSKAGVMKAKLQIDTRRWVMGRMCPKKYGDKVDVNMSGKVENTHDGTINIAPNDMAISGIAKILSVALGKGESASVADTGKK
ncbi:MAG: hypothetical protein IJ545_04760 [Alphaproteobacteria bacterium]|nr:hypothetical protein [Alphaproteobacteria bacterium]